jgi:hypothetical protein
MFICIAIAMTCWFCTLVALPRKPLPGNEVEELVYSRLLGRQQRVALVAVIASGVALLGVMITLPEHAGSDAPLPTEQACWIAALADQPVCGAWQPLATQGVQPVQRKASPAMSTGTICTTALAMRPTCYTPQPSGGWQVAEMETDGRWRLLGTQAHPPSLTEVDPGGSG